MCSLKLHTDCEVIPFLISRMTLNLFSTELSYNLYGYPTSELIFEVVFTCCIFAMIEIMKLLPVNDLALNAWSLAVDIAVEVISMLGGRT